MERNAETNNETSYLYFVNRRTSQAVDMDNDTSRDFPTSSVFKGTVRSCNMTISSPAW